MKKSFYLLLLFAGTNIQMLTAQVNIVVAPDSVYREEYATESEIPLTSHITNNSGNTVTIRWTRVVEQEPQGWDHAFCDKNLCYLGTVSSKTFELVNGEEGLLKPIFYPNEIVGTGVMRLYYVSETPGVSWSDTAVYVAVATELVGAVEAELVSDLALFPNPAQDVLNVVVADSNPQRQWRITDAIGKIWYSSKGVSVNTPGQISVAQFPTGIYFLNVLTRDGQHVAAKRFVVER